MFKGFKGLIILLTTQLAFSGELHTVRAITPLSQGTTQSVNNALAKLNSGATLTEHEIKLLKSYRAYLKKNANTPHQEENLKKLNEYFQPKTQ